MDQKPQMGSQIFYNNAVSNVNPSNLQVKLRIKEFSKKFMYENEIRTAEFIYMMITIIVSKALENYGKEWTKCNYLMQPITGVLIIVIV